jgi:ABC-type nitrate/sulfonate/bicarbonate transport system substrate-binding protein
MRHVKSWTRVLFVMTLLFPNMIQGAEVTQKIRVGLPSLALTYMPFYVAQEKGFLKKVGLEAEYIQMNTAIQPQALINGNINFFPSLSTGISAAVAGLPLVVGAQFLQHHAVDARDEQRNQQAAGPARQEDRRLWHSDHGSSTNDGVVQEI